MEEIKCKEPGCGLTVDFEDQILVVSELKFLVENDDLTEMKQALSKTASQLKDKSDDELSDLLASVDENLESTFEEINKFLKTSQWVIYYLACAAGHEYPYRIKINK